MQHLRPLTFLDIDLITRHRAAMFRDSGRQEEAVAAMAEPFRQWLEPRLADGRYFGWAVETSGAGLPIAGLGMMEIDWPPHPNHPLEARRGYILNVYVEPAYRRRGIARLLLETARAEAVRRGLSYLILHATEQGRALYAGLGWSATAEMALSIPRSLE